MRLWHYKLTPHMESSFGKVVLKAFKDSDLNQAFLIGFLHNVDIFIHHHNDDYYKICCVNLWEKYIRGQPGFTHQAILEISEKFYE